MPAPLSLSLSTHLAVVGLCVCLYSLPFCYPSIIITKQMLISYAKRNQICMRVTFALRGHYKHRWAWLIDDWQLTTITQVLTDGANFKLEANSDLETACTKIYDLCRFYNHYNRNIHLDCNGYSYISAPAKKKNKIQIQVSTKSHLFDQKIHSLFVKYMVHCIW